MRRSSRRADRMSPVATVLLVLLSFVGGVVLLYFFTVSIDVSAAESLARDVLEGSVSY